MSALEKLTNLDNSSVKKAASIISANLKIETLFSKNQTLESRLEKEAENVAKMLNRYEKLKKQNKGFLADYSEAQKIYDEDLKSFEGNSESIALSILEVNPMNENWSDEIKELYIQNVNLRAKETDNKIKRISMVLGLVSSTEKDAISEEITEELQELQGA